MLRPHSAQRPRATLLAAVIALILLAGCDEATGMIAPARPPAFEGQTAPAIQLGSGTTSAGPWTGWLYPTTTGSCVVVLESGRAGDPGCSSGSDPFDGDIGITASGNDDGTTVVGSTLLAAAETAVITLGSGEVAGIPIVRPGGPVVNGYGYFMARFEAGTDLNLVVLVDSRGAELESYPFGR